MKTPYVKECLGDGVVTVAVSDNMKAWPMIIEPWVGGVYTVLGADGFGRSDTREALRRFFEIDKEHVVVAALAGLVEAGKLEADAPKNAMEKFGITAEKRDICMQVYS